MKSLKVAQTMNRLMWTVLLTVLSTFSSLPASAWGFTHCKTASDVGAAMVSNEVIAHHCHQFIIGEGIISKGVEAGKTWKEVYGDNRFPHADNDKARMIGVEKFGKDQYAWRVDGHRTLRTKEIAIEDITDYMTKIGFELTNTHTTVSGHQVYTVNLEEGM